MGTGHAVSAQCDWNLIFFTPPVEITEKVKALRKLIISLSVMGASDLENQESVKYFFEDWRLNLELQLDWLFNSFITAWSFLH